MPRQILPAPPVAVPAPGTVVQVTAVVRTAAAIGEPIHRAGQVEGAAARLLLAGSPAVERQDREHSAHELHSRASTGELVEVAALLGELPSF